MSKIRLERALFEMMDHGDIVPLQHAEVTALCDHLERLAIKVLMDRDGTVSPELASAVSKLFFAHGRHYGMTNMDMGLEEEHAARDLQRLREDAHA